MKQLLLAGTAVLGLTASGSVVNADPIVFDYTGSIVDFTVPTTDTYQIIAYGAQGGTTSARGFVGPGGLGAEIGGDFVLSQRETIQIAVGGVGGSGDNSPTSAGGGGGSFVVGPDNTPLVIAGGGGGGGANLNGPLPGQGGLIESGDGDGGPGGGPLGVGGGSGGGGGGGFFTSGGDGAGAPGHAPNGFGGASFFDGLAGGLPNGGFGGGGGAGGGSGGGGGYSGGAGDISSPGGVGPGGGGGSFDAGTDQILVADFQTGNGEVVITELATAVPEPASLVLLGSALIGLAVVWRRRRPKT